MIAVQNIIQPRQTAVYRMKNNFLLFAAFIVLALTTYNAIDDAIEDQRDEKFQKQMEVFMSHKCICDPD